MCQNCKCKTPCPHCTCESKTLADVMNKAINEAIDSKNNTDRVFNAYMQGEATDAELFDAFCSYNKASARLLELSDLDAMEANQQVQ